jgi:hypothetical protein
MRTHGILKINSFIFIKVKSELDVTQNEFRVSTNPKRTFSGESTCRSQFILLIYNNYIYSHISVRPIAPDRGKFGQESHGIIKRVANWRQKEVT